MARSNVSGLGEFRRHMEGCEGSYAVIGGTACDILLSDADLPFRATHDVDTVLVADDHLPQVARAIWFLVKDGGYRCGWGNNHQSHFYRFTEPKVAGYPLMIELFSKKPALAGDLDGIEVAPLHIDDEVSSLSAILLDDDYYRFMLEGIKTVDGISVLDEAQLIPFKAKAFLDLEGRRMRGEAIDSRKVSKHLRDVLRLSQLLSGGEQVTMPPSVHADMTTFLGACTGNPVDNRRLRQIGIPNLGFEDVMAVLEQVYGP